MDYPNRKNISITDEHLNTMKLLLKKHNGNFSSAVRELIEFYFFVQGVCGSIEMARSVIENYNKKEMKFSKPLNIGDKLILNVEGIIRKAEE